MTTTSLISKQKAADSFDVSERTIDRLRKAGAIDSVLIRGQVRITQLSLDRYVQSQLAPAAEESVEDDYPIPALARRAA